MMKKCPYCGADIEMSARFCLYCMRSLTEKELILPHHKRKPRWFITIAATLIPILILTLLCFSAQITPKNDLPSISSEVQTGSTKGVETTVDTVSHNHNYRSLVTPPTCTSNGFTVYTCDCGDTYKADEVKSTGHTKVVIDKAVEPTCTTKGLTEGRHCSLCSTVIVAQNIIVAKGHTVEVLDQAVEPTCTKSGLTASRYCPVCSTVIASQSVIPEKGHTKGEWVVDKEATKETDGIKHRSCSVCGITIDENVVIPAHGSLGLTFALLGGEATLTGIGTCTDTDIVIPRKYNGYPVTSIGNRAFGDCYNLANITIPDSVTSIGEYAFNGCTSLASITLPDGITSIGIATFQECTSLVSITIPDSVTHIGMAAFDGCTGLASITIPDGLTRIDAAVFQGCTSLASITIPHSVTSIGNCAFGGCESLVSITIPDSVTSIGDSAFTHCVSLKYNEDGNAYYLGNENNKYMVLMDAKDNIRSISISTSTRFIHSDAFSDCKDLVSITIPDSVTSIGASAFCDCTALESITIPDSVTSIGAHAFNGCISLASITIPDSVTSIGEKAFEECTALESINYRGTEAEWNAITKGPRWDHHTGEYTVTYNYTGE